MRIDSTHNVNNLPKDNRSNNNIETNKSILPKEGKFGPSVVYEKTI